MNLTVLLADSAQVDNLNKVHALGMGWTRTRTPTPPIAVVTFVELEPADLPFNLKFHLELHTGDDTLVTVSTPDGSARPVIIDAEVNGSQREESRTGEPLIVPIVAQFGPGMITESGRYVLHVTATLGRDGTTLHADRDFLALEPSHDIPSTQ